MQLTAHRPTPELVRLVAALGGTWSGYRALCRCPAHADRTPSLSVRQGDRGILVKCFAGCQSTDVLREIARIARIPPTCPPDHADRDVRPTANIHRIWNAGFDTSGTLAEKYLHQRGIGESFANLRYHPRCPKGPRPLTTFSPALLVGVHDAAGLLAIQRIFLGVEATHTDKLMIGRPGAGAWRGRSPANGQLAIAEGFETAARFSMLTGIPCWATLGAARLPLIRLPDGLTELIIAEDDDREGAAAAARAVAAYARYGLTIRRMPPPRPADLKGPNDWARIP